MPNSPTGLLDDHLTFTPHVGAVLCYELHVETLSHARQRFVVRRLGWRDPPIDNMRKGGNAKKLPTKATRTSNFPFIEFLRPLWSEDAPTHPYMVQLEGSLRFRWFALRAGFQRGLRTSSSAPPQPRFEVA